MADVKQKWFVNQVQDAIKKIGRKKLNLNLAPRSLLLAISKFSDKQGYCYPTQAQLEETSGIKAGNQCRVLKILKNKQFITVKRKYDRSRKMTRNYYKVHLEVILSLSIDQSGEAIMDIIQSDSACSQIEPNLIVRSRSNFDEYASNPHGIRAEADCLQIEPNLIVRFPIKALTTHKSLTTQKALKDIVQLKPLDEKKPHVGFDEFWNSYPRKEGKKAAYKIWMKNNLTDKAEIILLDILNRRERHDRWDDIAFIPLPSTYLNQERWEDEIIDKHLVKENLNVKSAPKDNYIEQLKRAKQNTDRRINDSNVSSIQDHLGRKMDAQRR